MFKNYLKVALRNLLNHKLYSLINILGLAIGLSACILIILFVRDELSYDQHWKNASSIYRLNTTFDIPGRESMSVVSAPGPAKAAAELFFSQEIERATRFANLYPVVRQGENVYNESVYWTDPETVDMFDLKVVAGDMRTALSDNSSLAVDQSFAKKYFGDENPIGQVLTFSLYDIERDYRIAAVFEDLPHNTVLEFHALTMIDETDFEKQKWQFSEWSSANNKTFFQLKNGASVESMEHRLDDFTNTYMSDLVAAVFGDDVKASDLFRFSLQALTDIQLYPAGLGEMKPTGDIKDVMIFIVIAGLILLIACINFMNLATAKSTQRAREVAMRKVLGASRQQLIVQFLGESVLVAFTALVLGVFLVEMILPTFSGFVGKELIFSFTDGPVLLFLAGIVVLVGLLGGVYPALIISGFMPARVLKANRSVETRGSSRLRNVLVVFQFTISIALIAATGVIYSQIQYVASMDLGFDKNNLLVISGIGREAMVSKQEAIKQEILRLPGVTGATFTSSSPMTLNENNSVVTVPGKDTTPMIIGNEQIDYDYLDTYQIALLTGRNYSRDFVADGTPKAKDVEDGRVLNGTVLVNEAAVRRFGFSTPENAIGRRIRVSVGGIPEDLIYADLKIIGVTANVNLKSLKRMIRPEIYQLSPGYSALTVRYTGHSEKIASAIEQAWKSMVSSVPFDYGYVDEALARQLEREEDLSVMLAAFSLLAVLIASSGLFGLATFTAERRTREIGIRKVFGASIFDVVRLLVWQFSKPVILANIIAWPIAAWAMLRWLENFPYRIESWNLIPLCLLAGVVALLIAWSTVGGNAARVARAKPVKALRYE